MVKDDTEGRTEIDNLEAEKSFAKIRYEMFDKGEEEDGEELAKESKEEVNERLRLERLAEIVMIESKTVFNQYEGADGTLDYSRKRATDCKHNTNIKLPGPRSAKVEQ